MVHNVLPFTVHTTSLTAVAVEGFFVYRTFFDLLSLAGDCKV